MSTTREADDREWWGQDVMPRIRWRVIVDALRLRREVPEGEWLPTGYGVAWPMLDRHAYVCMPVPLNLVAGVVRRAWHVLQHGVRPSKWQRYGEERYNDGRQAVLAQESKTLERAWLARDAAYDRGWNDAVREVERLLKTPGTHSGAD